MNFTNFAMMESMASGFTQRRNKLAGINIKEEYTLISQKKSRLSRALREEIVYEYENYLLEFSFESMKKAARQGQHDYHCRELMEGKLTDDEINKVMGTLCK